MAEKLTKKQRFKRFLKRNMTRTWAKKFAYQVISFLVSVAMVVGVAAYAFTKSYDERKLKLVDGFSVCVHTGAYNTAANSIEFVKACIENNASLLQLNIRSRPDGTVVMGSDIITTNNDGVPLKKAFALLKNTNIKVNLVVDDMAALRNLYGLLVDYNMTDRVFITGVEVYQADKVKENCPGIDFYINYFPSRFKIFSEDYQNKIIDLCERTGAIGIRCNHTYASRTLADVLHKNGYRLAVWTVDKTMVIKRMLVSQPDVLTTNEPQKVQKIINNWKK